MTSLNLIATTAFGIEIAMLNCNPPYGERMEQNRELDHLYKNMGTAFSTLSSWSIFVLTSNEDFQKNFGKHADKNRKLFNGGLKSYLYQYLGMIPR